MMKQYFSKLRERCQKNMNLGGGGAGGQRVSAHTSLGYLFPCSKPICIDLGSLKKEFVLTHVSILSNLFDNQD